MGTGQHIINKVWEKLIQILMDDFEGLKTSVFEIIADTVEIARENLN